MATQQPKAVAHRVPQQDPGQTRFVMKWNNGAWKIFDTLAYKDMEMFSTYKECKRVFYG